MGAAMAN